MSALGIRLNNPTNLTYVPQVRWEGLAAPPNEGHLCVFLTPQYGYRAAYLQLQTNIARGHVTIEEIIPIWAPSAAGNPTEAYIQHVTAWSGIPRNRPLVLHADAPALLSSMTRQEDGSNPFADSIIEEGIAMAQGTVSAPSDVGAIRTHVASNNRTYGGVGVGGAAAAFVAYELQHRFGVTLEGPEVLALGTVLTALAAQLFPKGVPGLPQV
jgi:hypothetical protein